MTLNGYFFNYLIYRFNSENIYFLSLNLKLPLENLFESLVTAYPTFLKLNGLL